MKITFLVENRKGDNSCKSEHGLSQWIEVDDKRILFDLGASKLYLKNANKLGVDLATADFIVLSHGHFDHCGKLGCFAYRKPLICHPYAFAKRKYNILNKNKIIKKLDLIESVKPYKISESAYFLGEIPCKYDWEKDNDVIDDSAIVLKTPKGLIITSGCAHSGICNTIEYAKEICKEDRIYAVLGGFHLGFREKGVSEKAMKTIEYFKENEVENAYMGHCTSDEIIDAFKEKLGGACNVVQIYTGMEVEL